MPARRVLYLTTHQVTAYHCTAGQLRSEGSFEAGDAANGFVAYLQAHRESLFSLAVNVAEEGFQVDTIPYLQSRDRAAVIERKLGQFYQGAPLAVAVSLGFERTRRKDERLLFAALNNAALFDPWLLALRNAEARLTGIYSLPLLSEELIERLQLPKDRCLLVTVQDTSIRQTFFDRGHLHFSRLSPLANSSISGVAHAIAGEAAKTQQYLLSQRHIARTDALSVHVLAHPQAIPAVTAACTGTETLRFQVHNQHDVARKLGLKTALEDSRADAIFIHLAAATPPRVQFARTSMRSEYRLWQIANALRAVGAVAFAGCALFAGTQLIDIVDLRGRTETARNAASVADQRYQAIARTFPPLPVSHDTLRQITDKYSELSRFAITPAGLYGDVSRALAIAPQIEIDRIEWKVSGVPGVGNTGTGGAPTTAPGSAPGTAGGSASDAAESAIVRGTVKLESNPNPRDILRVFDAFVRQLRTNPQLSVTVQQQPFDVGAEKSLKSAESGSLLAAPRPFAVTVNRKLGT